MDVETSSTGTYVQRWINSGTELARVTGTGRLGIGTQSPAQLLTVEGSSIVARSTVLQYITNFNSATWNIKLCSK